MNLGRVKPPLGNNASARRKPNVSWLSAKLLRKDFLALHCVQSLLLQRQMPVDHLRCQSRPAAGERNSLRRRPQQPPEANPPRQQTLALPRDPAHMSLSAAAKVRPLRAVTLLPQQVHPVVIAGNVASAPSLPQARVTSGSHVLVKKGRAKASRLPTDLHTDRPSGATTLVPRDRLAQGHQSHTGLVRTGLARSRNNRTVAPSRLDSAVGMKAMGPCAWVEPI